MNKTLGVKDIITEPLIRMVVESLGIENDPPEAQAELVSRIGSNIVSRITLEIAKQLPESDRGAFRMYLEKGDMHMIRQLLQSRIPDLDDFMRRAAQKEIEKLTIAQQ